MEIQELAYKIAQFEDPMKYKTTQLEVLLKENTNTLTKCFNQLFMLIHELLQGHSKQPYCSELNEAKSPKMGS